MHTDQSPLGATLRSGSHDGLSTAFTEAGEPSSNHASINQLLEPWSDTVEKTTANSFLCSEFIFYSVLVLPHKAESRLTNVNVVKPNIRTPQCAVLLALEPGTSSRPGVLHNARSNSVISEYEKKGWNVVSTTTMFGEDLARQISRYPKFQPHVFFPHTRKALYSDVKYMRKVNSMDAHAVADTLLAGSQFGITQSSTVYSLSDERDNILSQRRKRPTIVDDVELMDAQIARLSASVPLVYLTNFIVDGGLHARVIHGELNSSSFDRAWLSEYFRGCNRDQIAFVGAAQELGLQRESAISWSNFDRAGVYRSERIRNFTLAMHCSKDSVFACSRHARISI